MSPVMGAVQTDYPGHSTLHIQGHHPLTPLSRSLVTCTAAPRIGGLNEYTFQQWHMLSLLLTQILMLYNFSYNRLLNYTATTSKEQGASNSKSCPPSGLGQIPSTQRFMPRGSQEQDQTHYLNQNNTSFLSSTHCTDPKSNPGSLRHPQHIQSLFMPTVVILS